MVAKVVQHQPGVSLHEHARDAVICVADVIEMRERACAEAIESFLVEHSLEIAADAHELQFTRGCDERAGRVALRMNASHERGGCERSEEQSSHGSFWIQRSLGTLSSILADTSTAFHWPHPVQH